MWAFGSGNPKEERAYLSGLRSRDLQASNWMASWDFSHSTGLPILANHNFTVPYPRKDDALSAARKRIDILLAV